MYAEPFVAIEASWGAVLEWIRVRSAAESSGGRAAPTRAMPIYEYACRHCQTSFERIIVSSKDAQELTCPSCKSLEVDRILSRTAAPRSSSGAPAPRPSRGCGPVG
jgi:putative FmdB family regulatory protein